MRRSDLLMLAALALAARLAAAALVPYPPYVDPAYYSLVAQQLAGGHGFNVPVLWSFLEVGGRLPAVPMLPVPSNGHWMPLTSIFATGTVALLGPTIGAWRAAEIPTILLGSALVPFTYVVTWDLWRSRPTAWAAALLVLLAGPLLVMLPLVDNFAVFGASGAIGIWCSTRAVVSSRPGPWLVGAGLASGIATLARVDGLLLTVAPVAAWAVRRDWASWPIRVAWGVASALAFLLVLAPWLLRDLSVFGSLFPSASGHTLWITSYNEQFSIAHDPSLGDYLGWGAVNIIGSKVGSWVELVGRSAALLGGLFVLPFAFGLWREHRRAELSPFLTYFVVMFVAMGAIFTFHAPKGAFYHSALAWLPFAAGLAAANVGPLGNAAGAAWPFLRRTATHRFLLVAGLVGAASLSIAGSAILIGQWSDAHAKLELAGRFLVDHGAQDDRVMSYDPAALWAISGNPGIAPPYDRFPVVNKVVDAYRVRWVVVTLAQGEEHDPLGLWNGAAATDSGGGHPDFLPDEPAFSAPGVRVYEVQP